MCEAMVRVSEVDPFAGSIRWWKVSNHSLVTKSRRDETTLFTVISSIDWQMDEVNYNMKFEWRHQAIFRVSMIGGSAKSDAEP